MSRAGLPLISFSEVLLPEPGWRVDHAVLATYSADLVVLVSALISLSGRELDLHAKGTRAELVNAMSSLRGRVRILAQAGRVSLPSTPRAILGLLDEFLEEIKTNEEFQSWHPKAALIRYVCDARPGDFQWRVWIGSRNLTRATNWESGLVMVSRGDGKGRKIDGIATLGRELALRAKLNGLVAYTVEKELSGLTWDCPSGAKVTSVRFMGPRLLSGLPTCVPNAQEIWLISPFLDTATVRAVSQLGTSAAKRTLVSLPREIDAVASGMGVADLVEKYQAILCLDQPLLAAVGADALADKGVEEKEVVDGEEPPPVGLHAKLLYSARGTDRRLWLGSANATDRAWSGRNFEIMTEIELGPEPVDALRVFVGHGRIYQPKDNSPPKDADEQALEKQRNKICGTWHPRQRMNGQTVEVYAEPISRNLPSGMRLDVSALDHPWKTWLPQDDAVVLGDIPLSKRTHFIQVRLVLGNRMCAWLQLAPFDPALGEDRNHAAIAAYLTPQEFLLWLRSLLDPDASSGEASDWDTGSGENDSPSSHDRTGDFLSESDLPTVEEILRAWARDPRAFAEADNKMNAYVGRIEKHAWETGKEADARKLGKLRATWATLAAELGGVK